MQERRLDGGMGGVKKEGNERFAVGEKKGSYLEHHILYRQTLSQRVPKNICDLSCELIHGCESMEFQSSSVIQSKQTELKTSPFPLHPVLDTQTC